MGEPIALGVLSLTDPERYQAFYSSEPYFRDALDFAYADMIRYPRVEIDGVTSDDYYFACSHLRYLLRSMPGSQVIHPNDAPFGVPYAPTLAEAEYLAMAGEVGGTVDVYANDGGYELFAEYVAWLSGVVGVTELDEWFTTWNGDDPELEHLYKLLRHTGIRPEYMEYYRAGVYNDEVISQLVNADVDASLVSSLAGA